MLTKRDLLRSAALAAITATTARSFPAIAQTGADRPGFFKAKDTAEAGFIFGLPIVMNYGVMYGYAIDRNSGQFKAPLSPPTAIRRTRSCGLICGQSRSCSRFRPWTRSATIR